MATTGGGTGYPPMPAPRSAGLGWYQLWLTKAATREQAAAVLRAERETSVLDPRGPRLLWWRDGALVVALLLVAASVWAGVELFRTGDPPAWVLFIGPAAVFLNLGSDCLTVRVTRAVPEAGVVPRAGTARWRWRRARRQQPAAVTPVADWPPGSEAYALLSGAGSVQSVAPMWLGERVGLQPEIGASWIDLLTREGWLTGGGHVLGWSRLPQLHVELTDEGREQLEQERARLRALATDR